MIKNRESCVNILKPVWPV